jgi:hypothetical protein
MSFTRRCTPPRAQGKRRTSFPPVSLPAVAAAMLLAIGGCSSGAIVNPEFARFRPASIAVMPVRNQTVQMLDHVSFGGFTQRLILGAQYYDIPVLLRGAMEEAVVHHGYSLASAPASGADYTKPLPDGTARPAFDAVMIVTIDSWTADTGASMRLTLGYHLELYSVPTAEVLYSGAFVCASRNDARNYEGEDPPEAIRRSAHQSLGDLPHAKG